MKVKRTQPFSPPDGISPDIGQEGRAMGGDRSAIRAAAKDLALGHLDTDLRGNVGAIFRRAKRLRAPRKRRV